MFHLVEIICYWNITWHSGAQPDGALSRPMCRQITDMALSPFAMVCDSVLYIISTSNVQVLLVFQLVIFVFRSFAREDVSFGRNYLLLEHNHTIWRSIRWQNASAPCVWSSSTRPFQRLSRYGMLWCAIHFIDDSTYWLYSVLNELSVRTFHRVKIICFLSIIMHPGARSDGTRRLTVFVGVWYVVCAATFVTKCCDVSFLAQCLFSLEGIIILCSLYIARRFLGSELGLV